MKSLLIVSSFFLFSFPTLAAKSKAIYVGRKAEKAETIRTAGRSRTRRSSNEGLKMRKTRRVAVGVSAGGALGFAGANLELNISPTMGIVGGYGGGPGYNSFFVQGRSYLAGDSFLPFIGAGFARWFNNAEVEGGIESTKPGFLLEKFLSDQEKETGIFSANIVYPSVGAQFVNLDGDWAGTSIVLEVMMAVDIESLQAAPTGSLALMYYF